VESLSILLSWNTCFSLILNTRPWSKRQIQFYLSGLSVTF
jgi:hypothetical protein